MAQIVYPGAFSPPAMWNVTLIQGLSVDHVDGRGGPAGIRRRREEVGFRGSSRQGPLFHCLNVSSQTLDQGDCGRHKAVFTELALPDGDDALVKVHITDFQGEDL